MADDSANPTSQETVPNDVPQPEKQPLAHATTEPLLKPVEETPEADVAETKGNGGGDEKMPESGSFKEESNKVSDLSDHEKKALNELKQLVQEALNKHEFSETPKEEKSSPAPETSPVTPQNDGEKKQEEPIKEEKAQETEDSAKTEDSVNKTEDSASKTEDSEKAEEKKDEEKEVVVKGGDEKLEANSVDEDGAKTVEAIEESVVAVKENDGGAEEEAKEEGKVKEGKEENLLPEEVSIWGIPLLADERSDVILLKFLRARDFKVKEAFTMIKNTISWRKEFGIEKLMEENLSDDLEKAVFMNGFDKEGHPVCYNIYGEFQNKELYKKAFSDEGRRLNFLRWRIQFLEKSIRKLDFTPGAVSTIVQINDLKNSPGPGKWELRQATKQALHLLQDNYPEFVAKQIFINVPWWYLAVNRMISPFLTQRTKSKFLFAGPSKSAETLLRYIAPEQLPVKYGGLSKDGEFGNNDAVTEVTVRPAAKHTVEFPVNEKCLLSWELRVIGWDVSYGAEFVPSAEGGYTVIIQKARKVASSEEPVVCNSFEIGEPGKVVLTIDNASSKKKKKLLYRLKTKSSA